MATTTGLEIAVNATRTGRLAAAIGITAIRLLGTQGYDVRELDKNFRKALRDERAGAPMPGEASHTWSLQRELRMLAKSALQRVRLADNEIERLSRERDAMLALLGE